MQKSDRLRAVGKRGLKVVHVFNMANDAYAVCKGLRKLGHEADLFIHRPAHVASLPQWEDGDVKTEKLGDPFDPNWDAFTWEFPDWVHVWDARKKWYPFSRTLKRRRLITELRDYDLIVGHTPFAQLAMQYKKRFRKPYIVYDAGWVRYLLGAEYAAARAGYESAALVLFTNVDTEHMLRKQGYQRIAYTPFAIDTDKYAPTGPFEKPVFFHPSRQNWHEKGNDKLIRAFAKYTKRNPEARLILVEWGQTKKDIPAAYELIEALGINGKCDWVPVMPKSQLLHCYLNCRAVFDQFQFGALGTTGPEVLSCGVPLVAFVREDYWRRYHASAPPILNAYDEEQIYDAMVHLEDNSSRTKLGEAGRTWVLNNCSDVLVAKQQLALYEKVLSN